MGKGRSRLTGIGQPRDLGQALPAQTAYAFDVGGSAYEIDFATGKILNTGSAPFSDEIGPVAYDDIALSLQIYRNGVCAMAIC